MRAFIAIAPDPGTCRRLAAALDCLADEPLLRRVPDRNLHLTLAFLGEISPAQAERVSDGIARIGAGTAPFRLRINGNLADIGARGRVFAAAVEGDLDQLARLQCRLVGGLSEMEVPAADRGFRPHLTLARTRPRTTGRERRALRRAIESLLAPLRLEIRVGAFGLYRSQMGPAGVSYQLLKQSELGNSGSHSAQLSADDRP